MWYAITAVSILVSGVLFVVMIVSAALVFILLT